jgi:hypothetical protein
MHRAIAELPRKTDSGINLSIELLRLTSVFSPSTRIYELIFVYLAFDAAATAGMASRGTTGKQPFFVHVHLVPSLCAPPA